MLWFSVVSVKMSHDVFYFCKIDTEMLIGLLLNWNMKRLHLIIPLTTEMKKTNGKNNRIASAVLLCACKSNEIGVCFIFSCAKTLIILNGILKTLQVQSGSDYFAGGEVNVRGGYLVCYRETELQHLLTCEYIFLQLNG